MKKDDYRNHGSYTNRRYNKFCDDQFFWSSFIYRHIQNLTILKKKKKGKMRKWKNPNLCFFFTKSFILLNKFNTVMGLKSSCIFERCVLTSEMPSIAFSNSWCHCSISSWCFFLLNLWCVIFVPFDFTIPLISPHQGHTLVFLHSSTIFFLVNFLFNFSFLFILISSRNWLNIVSFNKILQHVLHTWFKMLHITLK